MRTLLAPSRHGRVEGWIDRSPDQSHSGEFFFSPWNIRPQQRFKPMVREQAFDVSEMADVTDLIAKSVGKPMVLRECGGDPISARLCA